MTDFPTTIPPMTIATSAATTEGYAALTQDFNPIHLDAEFARGTAFGKPIAHGTMALNLIVEAVTQAMQGAFFIEDLDIRFSAPTFVGQTLTGTMTQIEGGRYDLATTTEDGRVVMKGTARLSVRAAP